MKAKVVFALLAVLSANSVGYSTPISYISATTVPSSFAPTGGDFGLGVLTLSGRLPLVVHYSDLSQVPLENSTFSLITSLQKDQSENGVVQGQFVGGRLELRDADGLVLLAGNIYEALAYEVFADQPYLPVTLTINGMFRADSGSLLTDFTGPNGKIYEIIFSITPRAIDGFSEAFSGQSNISLAPMIPEPLTIGLFSLALGGLALSRRRKR